MIVIRISLMIGLALQLRQNWRREVAALSAPARLAAFTLIELSIVLVIIGLIVGGVLVGQDLIEAAKLRKLMGQISSYNTAINTFRVKYDAIPGDMKNATIFWGVVSGNCKTVAGNGTETCDGDGNKRISADCCGASYQHETLRFWEHLQNAGLIEGSYTGASTNNCSGTGTCYVPGENSPVTAFGGDSAVIFTTLGIGQGIAWGGKVEARDVYYLSRPQNQNILSYRGRLHGNFFSPEQALRFDKKFDDGKPFTGTITNIGNSAYPNCTNGNYTIAANYYTNYKGYACSVLVDAHLN